MASNLSQMAGATTEVHLANISSAGYHSDSVTEIGDTNGSEIPESNNGGAQPLPIDMQFNQGHLLAIVVYSVLMVVSAIGNSMVLFTIIRLRRRQGRLTPMNLLLSHLATADLLVTFLMMPIEIAWNATVSWKAGDFLCRLCSFCRIFGLYLSGFVLMCISLDRFYAVVHPLSITNSGQRCRFMLTLAWVLSCVCSLPQSLIFHVETHPVFQWYQQCVTFNSFPSPDWELAYNYFGFGFLYALPLTTILVCYLRIVWKIWRVNSQKKQEEDQLRRSTLGSFERAKFRTLKMTVVIVATFFLCWTPYNVMSLWYWLDSQSAAKVDQLVQKGLFLFACTNSCMNPLIYGLFHFRRKSRPSNGLNGMNGNVSTTFGGGACTVGFVPVTNLQNPRCLVIVHEN